MRRAATFGRLYVETGRCPPGGLVAVACLNGCWGTVWAPLGHHRASTIFFLVWVVTKSSPLALLRYLETAPINFFKAFPWYQLCQSPANQSPTDTVQASAFTRGTGLPADLSSAANPTGRTWVAPGNLYTYCLTTGTGAYEQTQVHTF